MGYSKRLPRNKPAVQVPPNSYSFYLSLSKGINNWIVAFISFPISLTSVLPGSYTIKLRLTGYHEESVNVNLQSGQRRFVNVSFGYSY